ncbi:N-succinylarginine dihydrolase [Oceanimonas baumannii]|uniref:N-succinylarginine dihydrolase n=1 Tax=Oceanimonas baumannii TaxID=129578 RepID=A0A235CGC6_9GAMM|nr:N-succinylarginine dihydrolase [Oceanimonas baumannii]OYD23087.1 N-succinylarginine dihydrolase [Oceanimonas baumannii]TDW58356.1 succinylarginine dihydrolase [Oceanimonas baumannii]
MVEREANFDGLVGPTHNYAGLSWGNVASNRHARSTSHPREAALQGLNKMKALSDMGLVQGVLAPQERPDIATLRQLGFTGTDADVLDKAFREDPMLLAACCSASSMWTANAATVSPGADTKDGRIHFTPANLINKFHRSLEHGVTGRILRQVFSDENHFCHHAALPAHDDFGDEGAANHTRLYDNQGKGLELFVYGRSAHRPDMPAPQRYPARQTLEASRAVARLHGLSEHNSLFIQQNPAVIDQGVFHNDVIAVGNGNVLFYHQQAFLDTQGVQDEIRRKLPDAGMHFIEVSDSDVPVQDAINSYLFNTQLVTLAPGHMALIAPTECADTPSVKAYLERLTAMNTPVQEVRFMDVKQSMQNGGGPACLRLRVAMNEAELAAVNPACLMNDTLYGHLSAWIHRHYRDRLIPDDLRDPMLLDESRTALDELTQLLKLGSVYPFQR